MNRGRFLATFLTTLFGARWFGGEAGTIKETVDLQINAVDAEGFRRYEHDLLHGTGSEDPRGILHNTTWPQGVITDEQLKDAGWTPRGDA